MHLEKVTFERIFDLHYREGGRYAPKRTDFSFEAGGKRHFAVQAMGWPDLAAGHTITAALGKPGNWQTLIGFKNHTTGKLVLPDADRALNGLGLAAGLVLIGSFELSIALTSAARHLSLGLISVAGLLTVHALIRWRRMKAQAEVIRNLEPPAG